MGSETMWQVGPTSLDLSDPKIMGIVNVTPDSFSDGGLHAGRSAVEHGLTLLEAGADILDVGGESTRPGAEPVGVSHELDRVIPVVEGLSSAGALVSVDTMKPEVARRAIAAGAVVVNDVTGLGDPDMRRVVAESGAGVVIMHMQGTPRTMQWNPSYDDVVADVADFLAERMQQAAEASIAAEAMVVDPGIGFGKTMQHNLELLRRLPALTALGRPVLVGASRKRFLGELLGIDSPSERDRATAIVSALAFERGASVVRVHDVAGSEEARRLVRAIVAAREGTT